MDRPSRRSVLSAMGGLGTVVAVRPLRRRQTGQAGDERWAQFGYDDANTGHAPDVTPPDEPIGEAWRFETGGSIHTQPAIVDGTVYVGSTDGSVYALDSRDGTERWRVATGAPVQTSPAVADGTLYVGNDAGDVYALDTADGRQEWVFETDGKVFGGLTVTDGTVYAATNEDERSFAAIDSEGGTELWSVGGFGTATDAAVVGGTAYVGTGSQDLRAYDAATGRELWQFEAEYFVFTPPTVADGIVFVGSNDDAGTFYAVDAADGSERWRYETGTQTGGHSAAVADGTVFVSNGGTLDARDVADGRERWSVPVEGSLGATVVDGTVYVVRNEAVAVDAATGAVQWRTDQGLGVVSPIAVVGGSVYGGSQEGTVYRLSPDASPGTGAGGSGGGGGSGGRGSTGSGGGPTAGPGTATLPETDTVSSGPKGGTDSPTDDSTTSVVPGRGPDSHGTRADSGNRSLPYGLLGAVVAAGAGVGVGAYWLRGDDDTAEGVSVRNGANGSLACKLRCRTSEAVAFEGGIRLNGGEERSVRPAVPNDRFEIAVAVRDGPTKAVVFDPETVASVTIVLDRETVEITAD